MSLIITQGYGSAPPANPTPVVVSIPPVLVQPSAVLALAGGASYGVELDCLDDLNPLFSKISGLQTLAQDVYHRWTQTKGTLYFDRDYGESVTDLLNDSTTPDRLSMKASAMEAEARKDERVQSASVSIVQNGTSLVITGVIQPRQGVPFKLVVSSTTLTTTLLQAVPL